MINSQTKTASNEPKKDNNMNKLFMEELLRILIEFHQFQIDHMEGDDRPPYEYNTLGLAEWLTFNKGLEL